MEREEEEDGAAGPLFPRTRAGDAEREGNRAPPRNKALYEILSVPYQFFPLNPPSESPGSLAPSTFLNQGCGHERTATNERNPLNLGFRRITSAADDPRHDGYHHLMDKSMGNFEQTRAEKSEKTRSKRDGSSSLNLEASTTSREVSLSSERTESIKDYDMNEAPEGSSSGATEEPEFNISPNDVVGLVGTTFFWKFRTVMIHQQRLFSKQVFELHRLKKVQELLFGFPDILLQGITPFEAPAADPLDFLVNPQKQLFTEKGQSDLVDANLQQEVDRSSARPLPWYLQTRENIDRRLLPAVLPTEGPSYNPLTSSNGGPGPVPEAQQQMRMGLPVSGPEVDRLRRESSLAIPRKRLFSDNSRGNSSNLLVEGSPGYLTPHRRASPLEGSPGSSTPGSGSLTYFPRVSPLEGSPGSSTSGSGSLTYLPWVSPLEGSPGSSTPLRRKFFPPEGSPVSSPPLLRLFPLEGSSSSTPLPRVSPLEVSRSPTPLPRVSPLEASSSLTRLPRISPRENSAPLTPLPRVSPLELSDTLTPLPRFSSRESSRRQSRVIRVSPHDPKSAARIFHRQRNGSS